MRTQLGQTPSVFGTVLIFVSISTATWGQLYSGSLSGIAIDPSGAPVVQAKVTLTGTDRNTRQAAITDGTGRYLFRSLPPGNYSVQVEAAGFDLLEIPNILIDVSENVLADAKLTEMIGGRR